MLHHVAGIIIYHAIAKKKERASVPGGLVCISHLQWLQLQKLHHLTKPVQIDFRRVHRVAKSECELHRVCLTAWNNSDPAFF